MQCPLLSFTPILEVAAPGGSPLPRLTLRALVTVPARIFDAFRQSLPIVLAIVISTKDGTLPVH